MVSVPVATLMCCFVLVLPARAAVCDVNRCNNGGTCQVNRGTRFVCQCPENYYGRLCEKANPCLSSNVCENGGECQFAASTPRGYRCLCPEKFIGRNCQFVNPCSAGGPCKNGGECYAYFTGTQYQYTCFCPPTHHGQTCERESVCKKTKCQHGGRCFGTTQAYCACPSNYTGQLCERKRCSADLSTCGYIHQLHDTTYGTCSNLALQQYINMTTCRKLLYDQAVANKDCACVPEDLHIYFTDHVGSPLEARARWYCLRVYASHPSTCSNKTARCGRLLLQSVMNWADGNNCSQSQMDLRNEELACVEDILSGNMDMENCDMYEYFFNYTANILKQQVLLKCSRCDLSSISRDCVTAEFSTRPQAFCKMNYVRMKNCMLGKMQTLDVCKPVVPYARAFLDMNMKKALNMWNPVCSKVTEFETIREQWQCTQEQEENITTPNHQKRSTDPLSILNALFWKAL